MNNNNNDITRTFLGHELKVKYSLTTFLSSIMGIGYKRALLICAHFGIKPNIKVEKISDEKLFRIQQFLEKKFLIEKKLKKFEAIQVRKLVQTGSFRSAKFKLLLPTRGQSGRTNGLTARRLNKLRFSK
jgi:small subunit ribosomal protein S13